MLPSRCHRHHLELHVHHIEQNTTLPLHHDLESHRGNCAAPRHPHLKLPVPIGVAGGVQPKITPNTHCVLRFTHVRWESGGGQV